MLFRSPQAIGDAAASGVIMTHQSLASGLEFVTDKILDDRALDDPGPRLRDNGRRNLTYADLHTIGGSKDSRGATREIQLRLTGNMQRFIWGFDGKKFSQAQPLHFDHGERLRIVLSNDTMMAHPIHLHGMFGELEAANGEVLVRKHTFIVQPGKQLSYLVTADNPGQWAYHCHLLYHMEAGMFREVVVA